MASRGRGGGRGPPRQSPTEELGWGEGEGWYAPPPPPPPPFYHHPPPMGPVPPLMPTPYPGPYGHFPNQPPFLPPFNPQNQGQGSRQGSRGQRNRGGRQPGGQAVQRGGVPQQRQGAPNATGGRGPTEQGNSGGGRFVETICYNCGVPGHFSSDCTRPVVCFVCFKGDHQAELCPRWGEEHQAVQSLGCASQGLDFFHIDCSHTKDRFQLWNAFENWGIFTIECGDLDQDSLLMHLKELIDKDWPWQLIKMDSVSYIARFPPHKKVESVMINDASYFFLENESIMVSLKVWEGNVKPVASLSEVWVQVVGIPPKWCDWKTLWQVASTMGKLVKVDWQSLFASCFAMVRIQIKCRDPTKIPMQRMVEMKDEMFVITFIAEGVPQIEESQDKGGNDADGAPQGVHPLDGDTNLIVEDGDDADVTRGPVIPEEKTKMSPHVEKNTMGKAESRKRRRDLEEQAESWKRRSNLEEPAGINNYTTKEAGTSSLYEESGEESIQSDHSKALSERNYVLSARCDLTAEQEAKIAALVKKIQPEIPVLVVQMRNSYLNLKRSEMTICMGYAAQHFPKESQYVTLECRGKKWRPLFHIKRKKSGYILSMRWQEFARDNGLREDDICLFQPIPSKEGFRVMVHLLCEPSTCSRSLRSHMKRGVTSTAHVHEKSGGTGDCGEASSSKSPLCVVLDDTCLTAAQDKAVREKAMTIKAEVSIFVATMNNKILGYNNEAVILDFSDAADYLPDGKQALTLRQQGQGRAWRTNLHNRLLLATGEWRQFAHDNGLEDGDICLFEPMKNERLAMLVHIIRSKQYP